MWGLNKGVWAGCDSQIQIAGVSNRWSGFLITPTSKTSLGYIIIIETLTPFMAWWETLQESLTRKKRAVYHNTVSFLAKLAKKS